MHMGGGFTRGERGGEDAHTVTLTEMPQHTHFLEGNTTTAATANAFTPAANDSLGQSIGVPSSGANFALDIYSTSAPNATMAAGTVTNAGGNQAHENRAAFPGAQLDHRAAGHFPVAELNDRAASGSRCSNAGRTAGCGCAVSSCHYI